MQTVPQNDEQLRAAVRDRYTKSVLNVLEDQRASTDCCGSDCCSPTQTDQVDQSDMIAGTLSSQGKVVDLPIAVAQASAGCCGSDCCSPTQADQSDPITGNLYSQEELGNLPIAAALASRGCGNPTALAELKAGERVLDLGSGGGIDVLLSARRVGPTGFAYGLDMTDAMLEIAEKNRRESNVTNVAFLKGVIENIPLPAQSIDVIISNCVINLAADKSIVLREAYRVLAPGGRFAVSDIIFQGQFPALLRADLESWAGCIAGALEEETYSKLLQEAGFTNIAFEVTRRYTLQEIAESGARASIEALPDAERAQAEGKFVSAFIRAQKPLS